MERGFGRGRGWKIFEMHVRQKLDYLEEIVHRNKAVKGTSGEVLDGNEEHITEHWRKSSP